MRQVLTSQVLLLLCFSSLGFAVDRAKFRTCDQTSFCRRHRDDHSSRLYRYRLVKDSVIFHGIPEKDEKEPPADTGTLKTGLWKSLQKNLGLKDAKDQAKGPDIYVRGTEPTVSGLLVNTASETSTGLSEQLNWAIYAMADGVMRMRITEVYGKPGSPHEKARVTYDDLVLTPEQMSTAGHATLIQGPASEGQDNEHVAMLSKLLPPDANLENYMALLYGDSESEPGMILVARLSPFSVYLFREANMQEGPIVILGDQNRMHFEVRRTKQGAPKQEEKPTEEEGKKESEKEIVGYWEDGLAIYADGTREEKKKVEEDHRKLTEEEQGELDKKDMWEEKFQEHHDSKPYGPMSIGMDITFPKSRHLFGLPEHASSTVLKTTHGDGAHYRDPYRLYNLDVFEYELDETMALYGHVPLIVSQSVATGTTGVFWFNPTETFVDIMDADGDQSTTSHWMSESGVMDIFLMPGPNPSHLYRQYSKLTGTMPLPPMFSLGYHQCRWNYKDEQDVYTVHGKFEEYDYPYDVLWLDIEHTDGKRYFTWDKHTFPNPVEMQNTLAAQGRRMVTIIDPHIKRDDNYYIHKEATARGLYIKDKSGNKDYDGWCWPGSSSYLDFTSTKVRDWWASQFAYNKYKGSTTSLFTWNDMNEPSVFNGPEVSMQKDLRNLNGEEHREWHNLYGMLFHRSTGEGQIRRNYDEDVRPFVLSRAFFAGSQQYGAIWTGDNKAEWSHLEIASPMLLSLNVAALSFVGADVGGFFGNPDAELNTRWMQAAAYQPFFRGHAHHDSKRREPWVFGDETLVRLRKAAMERYALLPYWYSVFQEAGTTGMPVMRTIWMQYPMTELMYSVDDEFLIGSDLLVKPITAPGVTETDVTFPGTDIWYDAERLNLVSSIAPLNGYENVRIACPIDAGTPVYQRGGSIIPRKLRLRRSAKLMKKDPYTLFVALDASKKASGRLYMDDEETFAHLTSEEYAEANFSADFSTHAATISNSASVGDGWIDNVLNMSTDRAIERIIVMGIDSEPKSIAQDEEQVQFHFVPENRLLVIRKPWVSALLDWELMIAF
ncbi:Neutral alpha-glucosidase C (Fragment) [Seminavis robusta]|uniref:Glucosidase II subunit alpha n=1 Tax=Seminavis robusta TaxID=568900 RepID=A0A9N8DBY1_9STRA